LKLEKISCYSIFLLEDSFHFFAIELDFEVCGLEKLHVSEGITIIRYKLLQVILQLVLLLIKNRQFIKKALPPGFIYPCDLIESVWNVLNHLMKLFHIYLQDDTLLTDTFD